MRIYVASSWRNEYQPSVVLDLRDAGHEVYDFRNPSEGDSGFHWSEIDRDWETWTPEKYVRNLSHEIARRGYESDFRAMEQSDACVLVLPCGASAHIEAGWFSGSGKELFILVPPEFKQPELMYLLAGTPSQRIHTTMLGLLTAIATGEERAVKSHA